MDIPIEKLLGKYWTKIQAVSYILQYDSKSNFLNNQILPIFNDYDKEKRAFLSTLAIMSAAIDAFSFTLFKSEFIKSPDFLITGNIMLLVTIVSSVISYLIIFCSNQSKLHDTYFDLIGMMDSNTRLFNDYVLGKVPEKEVKTKITELEQKKFTKPKKPNYWILIVNCVLFTASIVAIGLSFIKF